MLIPTCAIKFIELMLTIACLTLHQYSYDLTELHTLMLCSGTYVGFIIVLSGEIVGEITNTPLDLVQDMFFSVLGVCLFSISGGLVMLTRVRPAAVPHTGDHGTAMFAAGSALLNAVLMLFDLALAYIYSEEYDEESDVVSASADVYVDAWWTASGAALFGACAVLTLQGWRDVALCPRRKMAQAAAGCAIANTIFMILDSFLALCSERMLHDEVSSRDKPSAKQ